MLLQSQAIILMASNAFPSLTPFPPCYWWGASRKKHPSEPLSLASLRALFPSFPSKPPVRDWNECWRYRVLLYSFCYSQKWYGRDRLAYAFTGSNLQNQKPLGVSQSPGSLLSCQEIGHKCIFVISPRLSAQWVKEPLRSIEKQFCEKHAKFFFNCPWLQMYPLPSGPLAIKKAH
jgi:hypothetical protein